MADLNGYTALYEKRAGNTQTYGTGGAFSCNIDIATMVAQAPDVTITTADSLATINAALNNPAYQYIAITNGDYSAKGSFVITQSGSSGARRVLRYIRAADTDDEPWNQTSANQVKIDHISFSGADYWILHRLTCPAVTTGWTVADNRIQFDTSTCSDIIINRCLVEGATFGTNSHVYGAVGTGPGGIADRLSLQNSVIRNNENPNGDEGIGIAVENGTDVHIINNEVYDWGPKNMQPGYNSDNTMAGCIMENNDLYATTALDTRYGGHTATAGRRYCKSTEIKTKGTAANPVKYIHNRTWGARWTDATGWNTTGTAGHGIGTPRAVPGVNSYILYQDNIIFDCQSGIMTGSEGTCSYQSIIGNIFWKIRNYYTGASSNAILFEVSDKVEAYLNTVVDGYSWTYIDGSYGTADIRGNVIITGGTRTGGTPSVNTIADYNAFYGTTVYTINGTATNVNKPVTTLTGSFCTTRGCISTANTVGFNVGDIVRTSANPEVTCTGVSDTDCFLYKVVTVGSSGTIQAVRGPYSFYRKLKTNPELMVIPYCVPHSSAPDYLTCPTQGETNATGSLTGIGIDDTQLGSGGFMDTGIKGSRTH